MAPRPDPKSDKSSAAHRNAKQHTLLTLRNVVKRDPEAYVTEFEQQLSRFDSMLQIIKLKAGDGQASSSHSVRKNKDFNELVDFLAHVAPCFPERCRQFPAQLLDIIQNHHEAMDSDMRRAIVSALILLRNRNFVSPLSILPSFFELFSVQDKSLRRQLFAHIVADVTRVNKNAKDVKLNSALQNFMFKMLKDTENQTAVKKSLNVIIALYRKRVWCDTKTVNVVAQCCFSQQSAIIRGALNFFLGDLSGVKDDDEKMTAADLRMAVLNNKKTLRHTKKRKKREREIERTQERMKKTENAEQRLEAGLDYSALRSLYDPQGFAERLFSTLKRTKQSFDVRLLYMNVISRVLGCHQAILFSFYDFLRKYMAPHQQNVTQILTYVVQSCHKLVPPEILEPTLRHIADQFVSDRSSPEACAVGINSIRELCMRQPLLMNEALLQDLVMYRSFKNKSVQIAARSLLQYYRSVNPELLAKKDRGRPTGMETGLDEFGVEKTDFDVDGADLLDDPDNSDNDKSGDSDDGWKVRSDDSDSDDSEDDDSDSAEVDLDDFEVEQVHHSGDDENSDDSSASVHADTDDVVAPIPQSSETTDTATTASTDTATTDSSELKSKAKARILTPADFERIKKLRLKRAMRKAHARGQVGVEFVDRNSNDRATSEDAVGHGDIEAYSAIRSRALEEKLQDQRDKRELDAKWRGRDRGGTATNTEKERNKLFTMVKQRARGKRKRSASSKKTTQLKHQEHEKKMGKRKRIRRI